MADDLNQKTYYAGAAIAGLSWSFTRPAADTVTDYTGCAIALRIYEQNSKGTPATTSPTLALSLGNGITRVANTASTQSGLLEITATQIGNLLGTTSAAKRFGYVWSITPTGGAPLRAPLGGGFDGWFILAQEGYAGSSAIKPA